MIILFHFYEYGSLHDLIHNQRLRPLLKPIAYTETMILHLAEDIACGMKTIHAFGLAHQDMKVGSIDFG